MFVLYVTIPICSCYKSKHDNVNTIKLHDSVSSEKTMLIKNISHII